ncbi:MAG: phosphatase PAP2 family protein [Ruminiclostridium sp.]
MKTLRYLLTIGLPLIIFVFITVNVVNQNTNSFDSYVYQGVSSFISTGLTDIMRLITFFGSREFFIVLALILIVAFYRKEKFSFYTSMIVINIILSSLLNEGIKYIFHRNRPDILKLIDIGGYSFPSGHSMVSMSFYGFLIYLCCKNYKTKWKYLIISLLAILILLVGLSRIYLGVHYASDVLGGFTLGILWVGVYSIVVDLRYRNKHANIR